MKQNMTKLCALLLCGVMLCACAPAAPAETWSIPADQAALQEDIRYIIHAAGDIDGMAGSNSLEALEQTYDAGCRYVEIDFQFTADGELACIHDWYRQYTSAIPADGTALTLAEFQACQIYDRYTPLWLDSLADYMTEHPDLYIVTDIKDRNTEGAAKIAADYPELVDRFLIQIYDGSEYEAVREAGFGHIIYTLYRLDWNSKTDTKALTAFAQTHPLLGYTFAYELCDVDGYVEGMLGSGVPLYVHTVNGAEAQQVYFDMGISGVYTDERHGG